MKLPALAINLNFWVHFRVGPVVVLWLVAFLVLIGLFDGAELTLSVRSRLMPPSGILFIITRNPGRSANRFSDAEAF